jgi:hypothetical protein
MPPAPVMSTSASGMRGIFSIACQAVINGQGSAAASDSGSISGTLSSVFLIHGRVAGKAAIAVQVLVISDSLAGNNPSHVLAHLNDCAGAIKSGQGDGDRKGCERLKAKVEGYSSPCGALSDYDGYEKRTVPGAKTQMKLPTLSRGFRTSLRRG